MRPKTPTKISPAAAIASNGDNANPSAAARPVAAVAAAVFAPARPSRAGIPNQFAAVVANDDIRSIAITPINRRRVPMEIFLETVDNSSAANSVPIAPVSMACDAASEVVAAVFTVLRAVLIPNATFIAFMKDHNGVRTPINILVADAAANNAPPIPINPGKPGIFATVSARIAAKLVIWIIGVAILSPIEYFNLPRFTSSRSHGRSSISFFMSTLAPASVKYFIRLLADLNSGLSGDNPIAVAIRIPNRPSIFPCCAVILCTNCSADPTPSSRIIS